MLANYRTSTNLNEIIKTLKLAERENKSFLWQNIKNKRFVYSLSNISVNEQLMSFSADIESDIGCEFSIGEIVYLKLSYRDTVCKVEVLHSVFNFVIFSLPQEIKTLELRNDFRYKFKPSEQKQITLSVDVELLSLAKQEFAFHTIDISVHGICLMVSEKQMQIFEKFNKFLMTKMDAMTMAKPYELDFIYSQKIRFRSQGKVQSAYRVGFSCAEPINKSQLDYFTLI